LWEKFFIHFHPYDSIVFILESIKAHSSSVRPEQEQAVDKVIHYFDSYKKENPNKRPHFLWNAKMKNSLFIFIPTIQLFLF
jgi:hypothetical protein